MALAEATAEQLRLDITRQTVALDLQRGIRRLHLPDSVQEEDPERPAQHQRESEDN